MHVTVFGATGAIGSLTVAELLRNGHVVTAYARDARKVPDAWDGRVRLVVGELTDTVAIDRAVAGADVVVSALGPSLARGVAGLPLVEGTRHVLEAMRRHGVRRYVGHATPSVLDPRERPTVQTRLIGLAGRRLFPRAYRELLGMTALITTAGGADRGDLDWTIVRFTAPKDGPATGRIRVGFFGTDRLGFAITRADVAAFTAAQVGDDRYLRRAPAISN